MADDLNNTTCDIKKMPHILFMEDFYSGIPQTLLLNIIGFLILIALFGLLRKKAWNYGRLALLHNTDNRWMELFYGSNDNRETDVLYIEASVNAQLSQVDRGFLSWIKMAFRVTDDQLMNRAGPDGLLYVKFERCLILMAIMMMASSLFIALPINLSGELLLLNDTFAFTTILNLDPDSNLMWVHTFVTFLYLPIGAYIMRRFLKQVREIRPAGELAARTLLIHAIPKDQCNVETLSEYFNKEEFSSLTVEDIAIAHDIKQLSAVDEQRDCAEQARLYCENYARRNEPLKMYPHCCGQILSCCCKSKQVDALQFYSNEEVRLTALFEEEKKMTLQKPLGVAFVTLGTPGAAKVMRKQLRSSPEMNWLVDWAPAPSDIYWEHLSIPKPCWYLNAILINGCLFLVLFFLTTPTIVLATLGEITKANEFKNLEYVSTFLPPLMLVSISALMPILVGKCEFLIKHWTRSSMNCAIMRKTFLLLLLMVLILPSLGLISASKFVNWVLDQDNATATTNRWKCIFLPDKGALFVNYIITSSLVGCALELVRFSDLALYVFRICIARSRAERVHVRKAVLLEFPLGAHYAWLLFVFTMMTFYSITCPLITVFGLLYLLIKHLIDRHNLCFAYGPSVGGSQLAGAAANFAGCAPILALAALLAFGLIRQHFSTLAAVQLSGLAASVLGLITGLTLPASKPKSQAIRRDLATGQSFVPPVLRRRVLPGTQEETISVNSDRNSPGTRNSTANTSIQNSPKLYQNYGRQIV